MPTIFISNRHSSQPYNWDLVGAATTEDARNTRLGRWAEAYDSITTGRYGYTQGYDAYVAMSPAPFDPYRPDGSHEVQMIPAVGSFDAVTRSTPTLRFYCDPDRHGYNYMYHRWEPGCGRTVTLTATQRHDCTACARCHEHITDWRHADSTDRNTGYNLCNICWDYLAYDIHCLCTRCERVLAVNEDETYRWEQGSWCMDCMDNHTSTCDVCNEVYDNNVGEYCEECESCDTCGEHCLERHHDDCDAYQRGQDGTGRLMNYSFTPYLVFQGQGRSDNNLFMGVELETDRGKRSDARNPNIDGALQAMEEMLRRTSQELGIPQDSMFYFKEDGSLRHGMEIVSHPATLDFHRTSMPWKEVMRIAKMHDLKSHDTDTAGYHIHVSRTGLGDNRAERDYTMAKLVMLMWRVWPELFAFSRRTEDNMYQWALPNHLFLPGVRDCECANKQCNYCMSNLSLDLIKRQGESVTKFTRRKYTAVNTEHPDTLEFRLWRGTLKYETFMATMELTKLLVDTARDIGIKDIAAMSWNGLVERSAEAEHQYLFDYVTSVEVRERMEVVRNHRDMIEETLAAGQSDQVAIIQHRLEVAETIAKADILYDQTVFV